MRTPTWLFAAATAIGGVAVATAPSAWAAHAGAPYSNVDHSNDMGNDTGDSRVDSLNAGQTDENYRGPVELRAPAQGQTAVIVPTPQTPPSPAPR